MDSILTSIKKMLGIDEEYGRFDTDIIININSVFGILNQLGVGPDDGFSIQDSTSTWDDFIPNLTQNATKFDMIKSYIYLKVKLLFDPPNVGAVMESTNKLATELEWRLKVQADLSKTKQGSEIQNG